MPVLNRLSLYVRKSAQRAHRNHWAFACCCRRAFPTVVRKPLDLDNDKPQNTIDRERTLGPFLFGLAAHSLHFMEEFVTRFQDRFPALLGLEPWSANFFVIFN